MVQGKDVGDALVGPALAPIRAASIRLRDGAIADGIAAFNKAALLAGLQNGLQNAATRVGFPATEVERLLPWDALHPALDRLEDALMRANNAYQAQSLRVGGLLTGLSRDTAVEVYRESGALAVSNFAKRFIRDKDLYEPLEALATEIRAWEALIAQCGDILEGSPLVARSLRRRQILRIGAALVVLTLLSAGGFVWWSKKKVTDARARVEAIIANSDPCKVETITSADAVHATPDQLKRRDTQLEACGKIRAIAAREAACDTLAKNFAAGKLTPEDAKEAKTAEPLLSRAIKQELEAEDLLRTPKDMPCQDTLAGNRYFGIYAKYAAGSSSAWANATSVSDDIRAALKTKDLETVTTWRDELGRRGEPLAAKAILSGKPEDMKSAKTICDFQNSFGFELGKKCSGVLAFLAKRKN